MLIPLVCAEVKDTGVNTMKVGVNNRAKIGVKTQNLAWGLKKDRAFPPPKKMLKLWFRLAFCTNVL